MTERTILVVVAHPDDEVLGCGGTISLLSQAGVNVHVAMLADGISSRDDESYMENLSLRRLAAKNACNILGVKEIYFGDFPDNRMDTIPLLDIVKTVESLIDKFKPDTIYTHHVGDLNIDHRRVHEAVITACRPQTGHPVRTILFFEVPSSTEWMMPHSNKAFEPNWFNNISNTLDIKMQALDAYDLEMRSWPHPRSRVAIEHLSHWRGATIGVSAAEAFVLGRHIK